MSRRKRKPPRWVPRKPKPPEDPNWRGMTPERIDMARMAIACDPEDVTEEESDALTEYLELGGNPWAL